MNNAIKTFAATISTATRSSFDVIRSVKRRERAAFDGSANTNYQHEMLTIYGSARR